ncbi:MAG: hypothetical protein Q7S92_04040 [Candidatus Diapherotrites archaeon]|nr:hypothetical protein [Candidatus Diapherotrites archaeon]
MPEPKKRGEIAEQTTVRIPFEHLSEAAKQLIGETLDLEFQI